MPDCAADHVEKVKCGKQPCDLPPAHRRATFQVRYKWTLGSNTPLTTTLPIRIGHGVFVPFTSAFDGLSYEGAKESQEIRAQIFGRPVYREGQTQCVSAVAVHAMDTGISKAA
jgi:hypothetical protein